MKTYCMNMKIGNIFMVWESAGCTKSHGSNKLGYAILTHNKNTFARPKKIKTLVFILPKDSTKQLYKGNFAKQVAT